ncbi:MAG TPA: SOS response-associated peptidase [Rubrobacteraceae bacterium]|jgi:putative SOS response-associated peptidase YedK|nr:SOS response-associated peptidase [Rubrobacteraceae bacterium]
MCGRYTLATPVERLAEEFGFENSSVELPPNYNVAPTQGVAAVLEEGGQRRLEVLRWGLIPPWADDPQIGSRMINARAETAPEKPSFRRAFRDQRCLIPADGFYEWKRTNGSKQPYYIHMKEGRPFAFAGLWESWKDEDGPEIRSCTILTTRPNTLAGEIHDRMPVILAADTYDVWLDPASDRDELTGLLAPYPEDEMEAYPVSRFVNSPSNNDPRCIEPAA